MIEEATFFDSLSSYALIYSPTGGTRNHSYVSLSALY